MSVRMYRSAWASQLMNYKGGVASSGSIFASGANINWIWIWNVSYLILKFIDLLYKSNIIFRSHAEYRQRCHYLQPRTYVWITAMLIFSETTHLLMWYCLIIWLFVLNIWNQFKASQNQAGDPWEIRKWYQKTLDRVFRLLCSAVCPNTGGIRLKKLVLCKSLKVFRIE